MSKLLYNVLKISGGGQMPPPLVAHLHSAIDLLATPAMRKGFTSFISHPFHFQTYFSSAKRRFFHTSY